MLEIFRSAPELIYNEIRSWVWIAIKMLPSLIVALLVVIVFNYLAKFLSRGFYRVLSRFFDNETVLRVLATLFSYFIFLVGVFLGLNVLQWDQTVTTFLTGAGVVGLALSFAFQDLATNFISGMFIAVQKPLSLGDLIETNDYLGEVTHIGLRSITIRTFDEQHVIIPSKEVFQSPLKNYMQSPDRRGRLVVGVSYSSDLEFVQKVTLEAVESVPEVDKRRKTQVLFFEFGDSSINYEVFFWLNRSDQMYYLEAVSKVVIAIKKAYDANGINIPFPIRTLDTSLAAKGLQLPPSSGTESGSS